MSNNNYLELFLLSVEKGEIPDTDTLIRVASALKEMQRGSSFKKAFALKKRPGRLPLEERGISEIIPKIEIAIEYYSMKDKGIKGEMAKGYICDSHRISERTFDSYLAFYNEFKPVLDESIKVIEFIEKIKNEWGELINKNPHFLDMRLGDIRNELLITYRKN